MHSFKFIFLFFMIIGCQNSSENEVQSEVQSESCECATIQPSKFSYVGINNLFHILSNCPETTDFAIDADNAEISFVSETSFYVKSQHRGRVTLKLTVEKDGEAKTLDEYRFTMRYIHPGVAYINKPYKTIIGLGELHHYISNSGIRAELLNHDISITFPIVRYNVTVAKENQKFLSCQNKGYKFEADCQHILQQAVSGDILIFDEIITEIPGDKEQKIEPLVLRVK